MIETDRLKTHAASQDEMEKFIAAQKVLNKAGFVPTGEMGEEGPLYIRKDTKINWNIL
ncbi:MAG: hypothetical protein MJ127_03105 [Mogibacterium sp.]|nr:hypothetical protein [Mogibacterium sp.]